MAPAPLRASIEYLVPEEETPIAGVHTHHNAAKESTQLLWGSNRNYKHVALASTNLSGCVTSDWHRIKTTHNPCTLCKSLQASMRTALGKQSLSRSPPRCTWAYKNQISLAYPLTCPSKVARVARGGNHMLLRCRARCAMDACKHRPLRLTLQGLRSAALGNLGTTSTSTKRGMALPPLCSWRA